MIKFGRDLTPIMKLSILTLIFLLGFIVRVFSVLRFESIIHEFDPWFNFRTTKFLDQKGWYEFWNWYDSESWYPLGRVVGGTIFPGLMGTAAAAKWALEAVKLPMDIRNVCVFIAPVFSGITAISTYLLTKEASNKPQAGLFAALFISIVPSYISRSVAGSYDNEGVAIFALVNCFYFWVKAVNTGSILWSVGCALSYFYMVAAWGGYAFITNIIPIFVICIIFVNKFNMKIYIAYTVFYIVGTVLAMTIPFVTFNAIKSSEHLASHCVFFAMNAYVAMEYIRANLPERQFKGLLRIGLSIVVVAFVFVFVYLTVSGNTKWSGRSMTLLDPTYAKKYIPIVASVSEHQPTSWSNYFFDLGYLIFFIPAGYYYCLNDQVTYGKIFLALYGVLATYFSCVMIRLMLTLAPIVCIIAGIAISEIFTMVGTSARESFRQLMSEVDTSNKDGAPKVVEEPTSRKDRGRLRKDKNSREEKTDANMFKKKDSILPFDMSMALSCFILLILSQQVYHSTLLAGEAYASPSIIMSSRGRDGSRHIVDDYREAYSWLRHNTEPDARILSWWDYGYQITGMANRTVLVDNNTWNNTHIATVGRAFASTEEEGYRIARHMGANYVLVVFGGLANFSGDDISKFLWMIRIAAGVYPQVKENSFYSEGRYRTDEKASETMKNCLMYRLIYYRFDENYNPRGDKEEDAYGYDSVRKTVVGVKNIKLTHFQEVYTTDHWLLRIFKLLPPAELDPPMKTKREDKAVTVPTVTGKMPKPQY